MLSMKAKTIALLSILLISLGFLAWLSVANRKMRIALEEAHDQEKEWLAQEQQYQKRIDSLTAFAAAKQDSIDALHGSTKQLLKRIDKLKNYESNTKKHVDGMANDSLLDAIRARYAR